MEIEKENESSSSKQNLQADFESIELEDKVVEVPVREIYPVANYQRFELTGREVEELVRTNPEVVLKLIQENQNQQRQKQEQEFSLRKMELEYEHQMKIKKEENKLKNEQQNKNIVRLGIFSFLAIFISALVYSARVNDKNLPNTVITAAISLLAGGSTSVIAFSRKERGEDGSERRKNPE